MHKNIKQYLESELKTILIGKQIHFFESVPSTMLVARETAERNMEEGIVIIAEEQTAGRGRAGRAWLSPEGNLAVSIILKPELDTLPQLIMIASLAVYQTIYLTTGIKSSIKWPNDILINDKKVSGILIENTVIKNMVNYSIIGIGINTILRPERHPDIAQIATSLSRELGKEVSKNEVCLELLTQLEKFYLEVKSGISLFNEWKGHICTIDKYIQVQFGKTVIRGKAEAVTENHN